MTNPAKGVGCVIVAHGEVGNCLMGAVQGILGTQTGGIAEQVDRPLVIGTTYQVDMYIDGASAGSSFVALKAHHIPARRNGDGPSAKLRIAGASRPGRPGPTGPVRRVRG